MKFIDSNILVFAFTHNNQTDKCISLLETQECIINTLVLVETFAKLSTIVNKEYAQSIVKNLFKKENIHIINLDQFLLFESLKRQPKYSQLKIFDLIHYTTALLNNCSSIVSYDNDFIGLELPLEYP